jgi:uncharacterized protein (DUF1778 family)
VHPLGAAATRTARVKVRIAPDALAVVRRIAKLQGRSISEFLVSAALKNAQRTIDGTQTIRLSVEDQSAWCSTATGKPSTAAWFRGEDAVAKDMATR